jgi:hypothetical protein
VVAVVARTEVRHSPKAQAGLVAAVTAHKRSLAQTNTRPLQQELSTLAAAEAQVPRTKPMVPAEAHQAAKVL